MKIPLLIFVFFISCISVKSQIVLEHTYPYGNVKRINLPGVGERYYAFTYDYITKKGKIDWFDADHQPVGTQKINYPGNGYATPSVSIGQVSSNFFDSDPGIEYELHWVSGSQGSGYAAFFSIRDDNGGTISPSYITYAQSFVTSGGNKIIHENKVYAIPGFIEEYTIPANAQYGYLLLENEESKFWYYIDNHFILLNQDYSVYKDLEIDLKVCGEPYNKNILLQGKHEINDDDKIEIFNYRTCGGLFQAQYYSDADLIFNFQDSAGSQKMLARSLLPSNYPGLHEPKCWIYYNRNTIPAITDSIVVYDVLSGIAEQTLPGSWTYFNSDISGVKYMRPGAGKTQTVITALNPDYSVWAEFQKDTSAAISVIAVGEHIFDGDSNTKEMLSKSTLSSSYRWRITRSDGTVIFELEKPFGAEMILDQTPGLKNKLIVRYAHPSGTTSGETFIYSLPDPPPPLVPVENEEAFRVQPNPFSNTLQLDFSRLPAAVDGVYVFDSQGHQVYAESSVISDPVLEIPAAVNWPAGLYMVRIFTGGAWLLQKAIRH